MRLSDFRLSSPMRKLLTGIVTGAINCGSANVGGATVDALRKRGLLDSTHRPTDRGRQVAAEIVARQPRRYAEPHLARLIAGLQILHAHEPHGRTYASGNRGLLTLQEEAFEDITEEHRLKLQDLGWEQTAPIEWMFNE